MNSAQDDGDRVVGDDGVEVDGEWIVIPKWPAAAAQPGSPLGDADEIHATPAAKAEMATEVARLCDDAAFALYEQDRRWTLDAAARALASDDLSDEARERLFAIRDAAERRVDGNGDPVRPWGDPDVRPAGAIYTISMLVEMSKPDRGSKASPKGRRTGEPVPLSEDIVRAARDLAVEIDQRIPPGAPGKSVPYTFDEALAIIRQGESAPRARKATIAAWKRTERRLREHHEAPRASKPRV